MERRTGEDYPPPLTHAEYYYGFLGVTFAWQVMFLLVAANPVRDRTAMLEKAGSALAIPLLCAAEQVPGLGRLRLDGRHLAGAVRVCLLVDTE